MKMHKWEITYKQNGNIKGCNCFSKKTIIKEYLRIMDLPLTENISDLKVFKDDVDYTATLNRFLMN